MSPEETGGTGPGSAPGQEGPKTGSTVTEAAGTPLQKMHLEGTEELLKLMASALRNRSMYPAGHPIVAASCKRLAEKANDVTPMGRDSWTIVLVGGEFVFEKIPLPKITDLLRPLFAILADRGIESLTLRHGVTPQEISSFFTLCLKNEEIWKRGTDVHGELAAMKIRNITLQRIQIVHDIDAGSTDTDEARGHYREFRSSLTQFALLIFKGSSLPSLEMILNHLSSALEAMKNNRFATVSRLHTRHHADDLAAHSINTALISYAIAEEMEVDREILKDVMLAGLLHDLGNIDVPPRVENEMLMSSNDQDIYRTHPVRAVGILRSIANMPRLVEVAAFEHHMFWNGSGGFPRLSQPRRMNPASCIVAVASAYDQILRSGDEVPPEDVSQRLVRQAGVEFEPVTVACFLKALGVYPPGTYVRLSTGDAALVVEANRGDVFRPLVKLVSKSGQQNPDEDKAVDLTERNTQNGQYMASIIRSIAPGELAFL